MSDQDKSIEALEALASGEFGRARELYGQLLESLPDSREYACGLYTAGYWDNRRTEMDTQRNGRARAAYLLKEWDRFQEVATEKEFPGYDAFRSAMEYVLGSAADEYRTAFQEEGGGSVDMEILLNLGRTLIRIEHFQDAADILSYARRLQKSPSAELLFLIAEALAATNVPENLNRAISLYRDTVFLNPEALDPTLISSDPISSIYTDLYEKLERDYEKTRLWFGAYLQVSFLKPGLRQLHPEELDQIQWETERLEKELLRVDERFREKVRSRLAFYYLVLLYHYSHHDPDRDGRLFFEERLKGSFPDIYAKYRENRGL